ncbi:MAG: pentapeptide repeat-containing protein [Flavihumibacter sp.]
MAGEYYKQQTFEGRDFTAGKMAPDEFDHCEFIRCHFANATLSHVEFNNCTFRDCDLSSVKLNATTFSEVQLIGCKCLGIHFEAANPFLFTLSFDQCQLHFSSFFQRKMPGTRIRHCQLLEVDFTGADLEGADFSGSDLTGAKFELTRLDKADFRQALRFHIDPTKNSLKKARFSREALSGLLLTFGITIE